MTTVQNENTTLACNSYAALRQGGEPPWKAQRLLGLCRVEAVRLEALFQARPSGRSASGRREPSRPAFAHHDIHVAAVVAAGGYRALTGAER